MRGCIMGPGFAGLAAAERLTSAGRDRSVDYGRAAKLFVPLANIPPPSAVMSVPERFWCWTALAGGSVQPVVSCFAGSALALERLEVEAGPRALARSLLVKTEDG